MTKSEKMTAVQARGDRRFMIAPYPQPRRFAAQCQWAHGKHFRFIRRYPALSPGVLAAGARSGTPEADGEVFQILH